MENKTHYRKVFKSDHLGVADLEDFIEEKKHINLVFKIKEVKQEIGVTVAGKVGNHNIAYFHEQIKPLVLNVTNSKIVKSFNNNSPFVEDWQNTLVQLYIDPNVRMKGEIVGGVRINKKQPNINKPELTDSLTKAWVNAIIALKDGKSIDVIKERFTLTAENEVKLRLEAGI